MVDHNHLSYDPKHLNEDIQVTKRLAEAGKYLAIEVLDSLVVTNNPNNYISLKEKGYL
ncbi:MULTISPECIES: JAB domain-containing protein [unclassified Bacillus (in: firmicutes)]|uniref:JAB domain-containing protein n=1 Tax=unclassified Bacillus (in: firmicutes) TaxID=185979 RepID=UPI00288AF31D|nr:MULTISPECIES: JAB domain-containing protein [unclassified Bacillus (in: firmicutes)]